jgi:SAM-dependent methyltransferase
MRGKIAALANFNRINRDAWVARQAKRLPAGTRVLDVGAGPARYRELFAHCAYLTQDFCQYEGTKDGLLKEEWEYKAIDYVSDITAIPAEDGSFDAVLCTEVLEHVAEPIAALREMGRILKAGGTLLLTAPFTSGMHQQPYHFYSGFSPHFYRRVLPECGLEVIGIEPNGGFFRLMAQENNRVGAILREHYRRWHPMRWLAALWFSGICPVLFSRLDDRIPVEEFTVGYFVEARKKA